MFPGGLPYSSVNWRSSSVQDTQIASLQPMISVSAFSRWALSGSPPRAFTRANVWKVFTSGTSSSCLIEWPLTPDSQ